MRTDTHTHTQKEREREREREAERQEKLMALMEMLSGFGFASLGRATGGPFPGSIIRRRTSKDANHIKFR